MNASDISINFSVWHNHFCDNPDELIAIIKSWGIGKVEFVQPAVQILFHKQDYHYFWERL
jgi:hypothetical protein